MNHRFSSEFFVSFFFSSNVSFVFVIEEIARYKMEPMPSAELGHGSERKEFGHEDYLSITEIGAGNFGSDKFFFFSVLPSPFSF